MPELKEIEIRLVPTREVTHGPGVVVCMEVRVKTFDREYSMSEFINLEVDDFKSLFRKVIEKGVGELELRVKEDLLDAESK